MSDIQTLSDKDLKILRQNFTEEAGVHELSEMLMHATPSNAVTLKDLYKYAHEGTEHINRTKLEEALASNPAMRTAFRRIISGMVFYRSGEALAAGEAGPIPRSGKGFSVRYQDSQSAPDHIYIIIELDAVHQELKHILYIFDEEDTYKSFPLSPPRNGIIQILVPSDDPLLQLLSNPKTEVMLG